MLDSNNLVYMNDLPTLEDTICSTEFDRKPILNTFDYGQICESASILIDAYINENLLTMYDPKFHDNLFHSIYSLLELQFANLYNDDIETELSSIISQVVSNYFKLIIPKRSSGKTFIRVQKPNYKKLQNKIKIIESRPQPDQRTDEWYTFRHNLITASSAWKALDTQSFQNQIIYEKCCPLDLSKFKFSSTESPLHWGQKYEDVSIQYYEMLYKTKVKDYGCIKHDKYPFLGASPDGINVTKNHLLYGRMLEIKNIVNREITGIPKKEYWIQMQLQMETCNLNECDFLETRFKEYESEEEFNKDGTFQYTESGKHKGIMLYFMKDGRPHYEYAPFCCTKKQFEEWEEKMMEKNSENSWMKNIYWRLDEISCVLVLRNKSWFEKAIVKIGEVWDTIEKERVSGYQHRAPKRRNDRSKQKSIGKPPPSKFSEIIKNDGEQLFVLDKNDKPVIRIRTESFDEKEKIELKKIETEKIET